MFCGRTADEAGFVEAPAVALDLLSMINRLLTGRTLGSSSPIWHLQLWHRLWYSQETINAKLPTTRKNECLKELTNSWNLYHLLNTDKSFMWLIRYKNRCILSQSNTSLSISSLWAAEYHLTGVECNDNGPEIELVLVPLPAYK